MIFGYYHISMRSFNSNDMPELDLPENTTIHQKVKVAHVMWIPIFPLDKVWMISVRGHDFEMKQEGVIVLENKYGEKAYPWYSFLALIAIVVLPILVSTFSFFGDIAQENNSKNQFATTLELNDSKIENPSTSDLYYFRDNNHKTIALKVFNSTEDSIYFLAPTDNENKNWKNKNWASAYYLEENNPTIKIAFSKEEISNSYSHNYDNRSKKIRFKQNALSYFNDELELSKIEELSKTKNIPIVSAVLNEEVKTAYLSFIKSSSNLDSLIMFMDSASIRFYKTVIKECKNDDKKVLAFYKRLTKSIRKSRKANRLSRFSSTHSIYELLLYTRYVYHKLDAGPQLLENPTSKTIISDEEFSSYIFFLRLLEKGFLSLEGEHLNKSIFKSVSIPKKNLAEILVEAPSNLLIKQRNVSFKIIMNKENGIWKINIPSTYSYSENQISFAGTGGDVKRQYRELIRNNVKELAKGKIISPEWGF